MSVTIDLSGSAPGTGYKQLPYHQRKMKYWKAQTGLSGIENNTLMIPNKVWGKSLQLARFVESGLWAATSALHPKTLIKSMKNLS